MADEATNTTTQQTTTTQPVQQTAQPAAAPAQNTQTAQIDPDKFAEALSKALETRTQRVETGVTKSMAEQYGLTEQEAQEALKQLKEAKAAKLPEAAQQKINEATARANNLLIKAEVRDKGAELGLVDADAAITLLTDDERKKIKVDDAGKVTGVDEALKAQKERLAYLYGKTARAGGINHGSAPSTEDDFDKKMLDAIRGGRVPKEETKK